MESNDPARFKDQNDVSALKNALHDKKNPIFRAAAAEALGEKRVLDALDSLIQSLNDEDPAVRSKAGEALGRLGDKRAVEGLIRALNDDDGEVRFYAAEALGKIGELKAIEPLIQALGDSEPWVRNKAAEALLRLRDPAIAPLIMALRDEGRRQEMSWHEWAMLP
jgi:HEAT repeat protein